MLRRISLTAAAVLAALFLVRELTTTPAAGVGIRWRSDATSVDRLDAEARYLLANGVTRGPDNSTYDLLDRSSRNIRALVRDPRVADTQSLDRVAFVPQDNPSREIVTSALASVPLLRHPGTRAVVKFVLLALALPGAIAFILVHLRTPYAFESLTTRRKVYWLGGVAILVALVRFLTLGDRLLGDDHFGLWPAATILHGGVPYRDVFDVGAVLPWIVSLVGQQLSGHRVIGEVIADTALLAIAFALSFRLTWKASQSAWIAGMMLTLGVILLLATKLYVYPKLFVYPVVLTALWAFVSRPTSWRLFGLAAGAAMGFLFRHDHGIFIAPAVIAAIVLASRGHLPTTVRRLATCAVFGLVVLAPWLLWVSATEGLQGYFEARLRESLAYGLLEPRPGLGLFSQPGEPLLLGIAQDPAAPVRVMWREDAHASLAALETRYRLLQPAPELDETAYILGDTSIANVHALLADDRTVGVTGLDGVTGMPVGADGLLERWRRQLPAGRVELLPRWTKHPANAGQWLFTSFYILPFAALLLLAIDAARGRPERFANERVLMVVSALLAMSATLGLMRQIGKFCDVATVDLVVAGWLISRAYVAPVSVRVAATTGTLALMVFGVTVGAASNFADLSSHSRGRSLGEAISIYRQQAVQQLTNFTTTPPIDAYVPAGSTDDRLLIRYLRECTAPADAIWGINEAFAWPYYAERAPVLHLGWAGGFKRTPADQEYALAWVKAHPVPVIFSIDADPMKALEAYPLLRAYVADRYVNAATPAFQALFADERRTGWIYVDAQRTPVRTDPALGLPCFQ